MLNSRYHLRMNRRDLLKFFAAGTVIAPVSGSAPLAKLIEVPNVELFDAADVIVKPFELPDVHHAFITFEMMDGSTRRLTLNDIWHAGGSITPDTNLRVQLLFSTIGSSCPSLHTSIGSISGEGRLT